MLSGFLPQKLGRSSVMPTTYPYKEARFRMCGAASPWHRVWGYLYFHLYFDWRTANLRL